MTDLRPRRAKHLDPSGGSGPLSCPRCGLAIWPRATWLALRHCPRCLARSGRAVTLRFDPAPPPPQAQEG